MGLVNGKSQFPTLHSSETPRPIFMKLEIFNYFQDRTSQNFRGLRRRGWSGQITSSKHESFCLFLFLNRGLKSHLWTHPSRNTSLYVVLAKVVPFRRLERLHLKFDPLYSQKPKNCDFKLAVNGKL